MATDNRMFSTTIQALEDLNSHQYVAFALNDGKVANNPQEASGILYNKPKNTEFAEIVYFGECKFKAGGAISAGGKITVSTSGYFTNAGSFDVNVGTCKVAVTSGSVGTGFFDFTRTSYLNVPTLSFIAAEAIGAGRPVALNDKLLANSGAEADGVTPATVAASGTGTLVLCGVVNAIFANSYGVGQHVMAVTSGYFSAVLSGFTSSGVVTTAAASGQSGEIFFIGAQRIIAA